MWRYTISGIPATKFRTIGKSARVWDDYSASRLHAESELLEQLADNDLHTGMLDVSFNFYLPHTYISSRRALTEKDVYADIKPSLLLMQNFAETMVHEFLLAKTAVIVCSTTKKFFHKTPGTLIMIKPIVYKK